MTRQTLSAALLALTLLGAAACGANADEPGPDAAAEESTSPAAPTVTPTPTPIPTPSPTSTPTPTPSPTPTPTADDQIGDGDADKDDKPATAGGGICSRLDAAEVSAMVGTTVTGSDLDAGGDPACTFTTKDRRSLTVTFRDQSYAAAGGMAGAEIVATSGVEGTPEQVPAIGRGAFVVTGAMFGGEEIQGAGAVRVGKRIVAVSLTHHQGLPRGQVRAKTIALLALVAERAG